MSFMTSKPDLSNTIFSESDLRRAREFLYSGITRAKPSWLKNPQGPLGEYWNRDDTQAACFLIEVACMIDIVGCNITQRSVPRLHTKINDLLRRPSEMRQFYENLTELQVAFALVEYVSPLAFDPLVSEEFSGSNRPPTPDFAFQLPESHVFVEVTVLYVGVLDKWEKSRDRIANSIKSHLFKQRRTLNIDILLPLENIDPPQITNLVLNQIDESDSGEVVVGDKGKIRWEPFPIIVRDDSSPIPEIPTFAGAFRTPRVTIDRAFGMQANISAPTEEDVCKAEELGFKSLCNTLKRKRKQFPRTSPYLLVVKLGHWRLIGDGLIRKIQQHIWTDEDYDWITGIVLFTPREGFFLSDAGPRLILCPNPKARYKASDSLLSIFNRTGQFHFD
jgi:hypothetical protein